MVGEEAASSNSEGEGEGDNEEKKRIEPNKGVLRLGGLNDDDLDSMNGLLYRQMEDYELFSSYNMLGVEEGKERNEFLKEYSEIKEGEAQVDETPTHTFSEDKL